MLRINLLPIKAAQKHGSARQELLLFAGLLAVVAVGLFAWNTMIESDIDEAQARIRSVKREIEQLKQDVAKVEQYEKQAQRLAKKKQVLLDLESKRIGPARMLDDLATILTDQPKVWLTRMSESNGTLTLEGGAMSHENISDFQLALERRSELFDNIRIGTVKAKQSRDVTFLEWKMTAKTNYTAG